MSLQFSVKVARYGPRLIMLVVAFHPLPLFLRWSQGIADRPEERPGSGRPHVLELVLQVLEQFSLALPEGIEVRLDGTIFRLEAQDRLGVLDGRSDFLFVSHDSRILHQRLDVSLG